MTDHALQIQSLQAKLARTQDALERTENERDAARRLARHHCGRALDLKRSRDMWRERVKADVRKRLEAA